MAPLLRKFLCLSRRVLVLMHELQITQILTISQLLALERCSFRLSCSVRTLSPFILVFLEISRGTVPNEIMRIFLFSFGTRPACPYVISIFIRFNLRS